MPATRRYRKIRKNYRKSGKGYRRKNVTRKGKVTKQAVKAIVKKEIASNLENKFIVRYTPGGSPTATFTINPLPSQNMGSMGVSQGIFTNADFYRVLPNIVQGDTTTEKVGTLISPKSLRSHIQLALNAQTLFASSQNLQVRIIAFTLKSVKSYEEFDSTPIDYAGKLFWDGNSGQPLVNVGGQPFYLHLPINKRVVNVVMDKTVTLGKGTGLARNTVAITPVDGTQVFNNPHSQFHEMTVNWNPPKKFKYNNNNVFLPQTNYPTNYAPYIGVIVTQMDGGMSCPDDIPAAQPTANKNLVLMNIRTALSYEDA